MRTVLVYRNMKRRNAECGKIRRPGKRAKITDGIYGSTFIYLKFLLVWALVLLADFILELRFEYLWPFWLLLRSVYDSFKYQGLAFSVFFVFIALTSDTICFLFIPVHWLFFAASTYVWVQYVWHTERGICLPTISLWLLFVYIEASVRLKEIRNVPFHLDLCRPFAAHCIGYPVVTLGFGFKSYIGYRMRLRKQKEVAKENDFYLHLLQQALPPEPPSTATSASDKALRKMGEESAASNGFCGGRRSTSRPYAEVDGRNDVALAVLADKHEFQCVESPVAALPARRTSNVNDFDASDEVHDKTAFKVNGVCSSPTARAPSLARWTTGGSGARDGSAEPAATTPPSNGVVVVVGNNKRAGGGRNNNNNNNNNCATANNLAVTHPKDDHYQRLEADIKRLKADLQASRQVEQDLRLQLHGLSVGERSVKNELSQLQLDNENLQNKLHNLVSARQQDKGSLAQMEKRLQEERKARSQLEAQLAQERRAKKAEEAAAAARAAVAVAAARSECTESCKARRRDLESDVRQLRRDVKVREEQLRSVEREAQSLRQYKDSMGDTEVLMSALSAMQDKNAHLENSLSAETRLKLDLFSALGEAKRQLEICQAMLSHKEKEVEELKSKIAEVMAVMPAAYPAVSLDSGLVSSLLYGGKFGQEEKVAKSNLDPNASVYTPKMVVPSDH